MYEAIIHDKRGVILHPGDTVHNLYGYDLIVCIDANGHWYGKLVCDPGDSCENIPYSLCEDDIILVIKSFNND